MVQNWSLSIQRRIGSDLVVEADYFGTHSNNLYIQTDVNRFAGDLVVNGGNLARLNPSFSSIVFGRTIGTANSNLLSLGVSKRFAKRFGFHAFYTFGRSLDDISSNDNGVDGSSGGSEGVIDAQNPYGQYARSDYDVKRRLSIDAVWDIPGFRNGIAGAVTKGWTASPVIILQSGLPFTVYTSGTYPTATTTPTASGLMFPTRRHLGTTLAQAARSSLRESSRHPIFPRPLPAFREIWDATPMKAPDLPT